MRVGVFVLGLGLFMSIPPLCGLALTLTGEFHPLNQDQVDDLNREEADEPITQQRFQLDAEPQDGWHTFRVELKRSGPFDGPFFKDQLYRAESLWEWYKRSANGAQPPTDPLTRRPVWSEDWWALHERFDPQGDVPDWARTLPRLEVVRAGLEKRRRDAYLHARAAAWLVGEEERREAVQAPREVEVLSQPHR